MEEKNMNIALFPGSFSPAHKGHFDVVQKLCSEMDKVLVIKSNKPRDGISVEQSINIWNLYLKLLPDNVEVKISDEISPITECFQIIKNDRKNDFYIVFGKNEDRHVQSFIKLNLKNVHIYNAGNYGNISATNFRQAIKDRNMTAIKSFLPPGVNDVEFMEKMGLNLHEIKIVPQDKVRHDFEIILKGIIDKFPDAELSRMSYHSKWWIRYNKAVGGSISYYPNQVWDFTKRTSQPWVINNGERRYTVKTINDVIHNVNLGDYIPIIDNEEIDEIKILPNLSSIPPVLDLGEEHEWEDTKYMGVFYGVLSPNKKYIIDYYREEGFEHYIILRPIENKKDLGRTDWYLDKEDIDRYIDTKGIPVIYEKDGKLIDEIKIVPNEIIRVGQIITGYNGRGEPIEYHILKVDNIDAYYEYWNRGDLIFDDGIKKKIIFLNGLKTGTFKIKKDIDENVFSKDWWSKNLLQENQEQITKLTEQQKQTIKQFIGYAFKELNITTPLNGLKLSYDNNAVKERASFAYYDPNSNKIWVYVKNRNMADILRSIAHELVHSRQNEEGRLKQDSGNTGSEIENEANSKAGVMLRDFGKDNKGIYEIKIIPNIPELKVGDTVITNDFDHDNHPGWVDEMENYLGKPGKISKIYEWDEYEDGDINKKYYPIYIVHDYSWPVNAVKKTKSLDEIKIIPNIKIKPKLGQIWELTNSYPNENMRGLYRIISLDSMLILLGTDSDNLFQKHSFNLKQFVDEVRMGWIKLFSEDNDFLDEIKIQPNIRIKVGDIFVPKNYKEDPDYVQGEIIEIDYKTNYIKIQFSVQYNNQPSTGITSKTETTIFAFEKWLKERNYIKLDKDSIQEKINEFQQGIEEIVDEIKIVPNTREPKVGEIWDVKPYGLVKIINTKYEDSYRLLSQTNNVDYYEYKKDFKGKFVSDNNEVVEIKIIPNNQRVPRVGDIYEFLPSSTWDGQYKITEIAPSERRNECTFVEVLATDTIYRARLYYNLSTVIYMIKEKQIKFIKNEKI